MNRNFENEYKNYAESTAPDLWNRISEGIDRLESAGNGPDLTGTDDSVTDKQENTDSQATVRKKTKIVDISVSDKYTNFDDTDTAEGSPDEVKSAAETQTVHKLHRVTEPDAETGQDSKPPDRRNKTVSINRFIGRYGGAIAATACGVIGLMLASTVMPRGCGSSASSDYAAAPAAPAMEAPAAPAMEAAPAAEEAASYDEAEEAYDTFAYEATDEAPTDNADDYRDTETVAAGTNDIGIEAGKKNNSRQYSSTNEMAAETQSDAAAEAGEDTSAETEAYEEAEEAVSDTAAEASKEDQIITVEATAVIKSVKGSKGHMFCELIVTDGMDSDLKKDSVIRTRIDEDLEDAVQELFDEADNTTEYTVSLYRDPQTKMYVLSDITK